MVCNTNQSFNTNNILQKFMTNVQQNSKKLHEECNNFMENLMDLEEFAKRLKKPVSTVRTWKRRGDIPSECFLKIGGTIFVQIKKFNKWVENQA